MSIAVIDLHQIIPDPHDVQLVHQHDALQLDVATIDFRGTSLNIQELVTDTLAYLQAAEKQGNVVLPFDLLKPLTFGRTGLRATSSKWALAQHPEAGYELVITVLENPATAHVLLVFL